MKRLTTTPLSVLALVSLLATACADPTASITSTGDDAGPGIRPVAAVVLPTCAGCTYGPVEFTRRLSLRYEQVTFTAPAGPSYVMVVRDDGAATTGVEVILNGTQRVGKPDLLGGGTTELRIPVALLASNRLIVRMHGPVGASARVHFEPGAAEALTITPNPVERLPGGTQQFSVSGGSGGPYIWSVNGVDGGNATFGTITSAGFYTAPNAVPTPATFEVCARESANPSVSGCATVTINPIPSAGADVVVFNDVNVFDNSALSNANNQRMVRNLVTFTGTGPRSNGTVVVIESGHNSAYARCFDTAAENQMTGEGLTVQRLASATIGTQPSNVKVLILCVPTTAYSVAEINAMKAFASQGGRVVFVGEHEGFYGAAGIALENQFLTDMGAVMRNLGQFIDCGYNTLPQASLRSHQITTGLTNLTIACASVVEPGPNDFPLFYDLSNTRVLAGVAKVDVTPLPTLMTALGGDDASAMVRRAAPAWRPTHDPIGRPISGMRR